MKHLLIVIFLFLFTKFSSAQVHFNLSSDSDTTFWYKYKNDYAVKFHLGLIENDTNNFSFRFWSSGIVVKVLKSGDKYLGSIDRFVEEYPRTKKTFKAHYKIPPDKVRQLFELIDSMKLRDLPSDKNIVGWQHGFDGIEYFTEYKYDGQYSFKNYWTPTSQDSSKEAKKFSDFINRLTDLLELNSNYKKFKAAIPFQGWSYPGSPSAVLRIKPKMTKRQNK